jgi:hypothetical protein
LTRGAIAGLVVLSALLEAGAGSAAQASTCPKISGTKVLKGARYQFAEPASTVAVAGRVWVASIGNRATIVNPASGAVVKVLGPGPYHLWLSPLLAVQGNDVWTLGYKSGYLLNDLVELNGSTGSFIRAINVGTSHDLNSEHSMIVSNGFLWVGTNVLCEFNLRTGKFVRSITRHVIGPSAIAVTRGQVWEVNVDGTLSVFNATTGAFVHEVALPGTPASYGGDPPTEMAVSGSDLWVPAGTQVFKISTATSGVLLRMNAPSWGLKSAMAAVTSGGHVWIVSYGNNSVLEVSESTGMLVKTDKGSPYSFNVPWGATIASGSVWVANSSQSIAANNPGSVTVFPAT